MSQTAQSERAASDAEAPLALSVLAANAAKWAMDADGFSATKTHAIRVRDAADASAPELWWAGALGSTADACAHGGSFRLRRASTRRS
jgi:hypothetical protein